MATRSSGSRSGGSSGSKVERLQVERLGGGSRSSGSRSSGSRRAAPGRAQEHRCRPAEGSTRASAATERTDKSVEAFRDALERSVTLSRDRLQEVVDDAVRAVG